MEISIWFQADFGFCVPSYAMALDYFLFSNIEALFICFNSGFFKICPENARLQRMQMSTGDI